MCCAMQFELALPAELRQVLIADWERTIKPGQLRPLPRNPTVEEILGSYLKAAKKNGNKKAPPSPLYPPFPACSCRMSCASDVAECS